MVMDSDAGHDTSLSGDLAAFIGAAAMVRGRRGACAVQNTFPESFAT